MLTYCARFCAATNCDKLSDQAYREVVKNYRFYDQAHLFLEQVWLEK